MSNTEKLLQSTFLNLARNLLGDQNLLLIDGGASGKTWELPGIAQLCDVMSFEPNQIEYQKIVSDTTNVGQTYSQYKRPLPYNSIRYVDSALSHTSGIGVLNITHDPGCSSLLEPNFELISRLEYYSCYDQALASQFRVVRTEQVKTITLDQLAEERGVACVDYLKLDTQGNELDCLKGASTLLEQARIGIIRTEVEFHDVYKNQALFS